WSCALDFDSPTTLGTVTFATPLETYSVTMFPFGSRWPPSGFWSNTWLTAVVLLNSRFTWGLSPAPRMWDLASSTIWPPTNGTRTGAFAFSCLLISLYAYQPPIPAATRRSRARIHGHFGRRRTGASYGA